MYCCLCCIVFAARLLGCEVDGNAGVGSGGSVVAVSDYMDGLASAGDVLEMSVVRGVGGVCDMCMRFARGGVGGVGGEWVTGLGQFLRNMGKVGYVFWLRWCWGKVGWRLGPVFLLCLCVL